MDNQTFNALREIVGENNVLTGLTRIQDYLKDETAEPVRPRPASDVVVVKPADAKEISEILGLANNKRVCIFVRGGGTGLVGGAVPTSDGIVLSLERLGGIEIDKENLMADVGAGLTLEKLIFEVENAGLQFPLHPGDESAQVGGLVATNAGGANAIRYGVMRNYVRGMELVLPSGEILRLGGKLHKNNVGYDLMDLIIGSEGTLGVITRVILRLYPKSGVTAILIVPYDSRHDAVNTVPKILQDGRVPFAIEYVEKDLVDKTARAIGEDWPTGEGNCYLLIKMAEANRDQLLMESQRTAEICQRSGCLEILFAEPMDDQRKISRIRSEIYSVLKRETADILDATVPPASIGKLMDAVDEIGKKYAVHLPAYGHVGDGNLHIHIMKENGKDDNYIIELRDEVYRATNALKGVITGEHGIGRTRVASISSFVSHEEMNLMRKIKALFDPKNILNPGVKIPDLQTCK